MDTPPLICRHCGTSITDAIAAGQTVCPECNAALPVELPRAKVNPLGRALFWVMFVGPPVFSLWALSHAKDGILDKVIPFNLLLASLGSIYCGCWTSFRFSRPGLLPKVLLGFGLTIGYALLNLFIFFVGCVSNMGH